ncbi:MAG: hypothetical protein VXA18_05210, partial [Gammaproteobacteria bacterium]
HTFNHQSYFINLRAFKKYPFNEGLKLAGDYFQLLEVWCDRPNVTYIRKDIVDYDLSGATVGNETNDLIRKERLKSSVLIFIKTKNLRILAISMIQVLIYGPFLIKSIFSGLVFSLKK